MKEDKYWNFSKGERYATIIFIIATFAVIIYANFPAVGNGKGDNAMTEQYYNEIKEFEKSIAVQRDMVKKPAYVKSKRRAVKREVQEQNLSPKSRENRN